MSRLRELRFDAGLDIADLAERAGVNAGTIRGIEDGATPRASTAKKIADVFGLPASEVFLVQVPDEPAEAAA